MNSKTKQIWSTLSRDNRAMELAKTALGWDDLTTDEQTKKLGELVAKAEEYKRSL